ncbi:MAG TPA: NAD(P)H:quinone oxidoreductase [Pseudomonadota bacterium]|jgi:NAD(P)H dehydrogenase (quinone)|nr:NAD(P)H:quinone oxidoreductase [Deltaproteobacteria bacterium]HPH25814.1 NAD(P)H:quinone oxidoreductase [Pseudomonadota bacterium]
MAKVAVIFYSSTGTNDALARAIAEGAASVSAETRVRLVTETAPPAAISRNPKWQAYAEKMQNEPRAELADLDWADAIVLGTPTRFGNVAAQLKAFIDSAGGLWFAGKLANKVYAGFTSAQNAHGGQESTLLALYNSIYHFGGILVPLGYTDPAAFQNGGNPYGVSATASDDGPSAAALAHARALGKRVAEVAAKLHS